MVNTYGVLADAAPPLTDAERALLGAAPPPADGPGGVRPPVPDAPPAPPDPGEEPLPAWVTAADQVALVEGLLLDGRWEKTFRLLGGRVEVTFRTLASAEEDACQAAALRDVANPADFAKSLLNRSDYEFALAVGRVRLLEQPPYAAAEGAADPRPALAALLAGPLRAAPVRELVRRQYVAFARGVQQLTRRAAGPDF